MSDLALEIDVILEANPPPGLNPAELERLAAFALDREGASGRWAVAVVLTSDQRLRELHRDFMGIDSETDVMSFPSEDAPDRDGGGDIVVSVERAAEQAPEFGHDPATEVRFLVVHGLLHLCGWTDEDEERRAAMLARQTELLAAFDAGG